jgi:hypothetical protein
MHLTVDTTNDLNYFVDKLLNSDPSYVTDTTKKSAYRGGFEKLKTASIDYQTASIDMNAL